MANKYVVQLIKPETGLRSPSFEGTLPEIINVFTEISEEVQSQGNALVLIIGYLSDGQFRVVNDHLFYMDHFCAVYAGRETHFHEMDVELTEEKPHENCP